MARKRFRPRKEDVLKGTGYDSMLEKNLHETKLSECRFHDKGDKVDYIVPHTYEPDFVLEREDKTFLLETKGRFQDSSEARKYLFIREVLDAEKQELVFIFQKEGTRFPFARKRKDGTFRTQEEWCEDHGFRYWVQTNFDVRLL